MAGWWLEQTMMSLGQPAEASGMANAGMCMCIHTYIYRRPEPAEASGMANAGDEDVEAMILEARMGAAGGAALRRVKWRGALQRGCRRAGRSA